MEELVKELLRLSEKKDGGKVLRIKEYNFISNARKGGETNSFNIPLNSYNIQDYAFKEEGLLPIMARGLFITANPPSRIVIRGYDKFFNVGETKTSSWDWLHKEALGPFEITMKENGCIIYVSSIEGHILVTSKHSLGPRIEENGKASSPADYRPSHAEKGEEWLNKHLQNVGSSHDKLSAYLEKFNVTAVFELADDDFEEHVLEYPEEKRGLYCHGLNFNKPVFETMSSDEVQDFAKTFGFLTVKLSMKDTTHEVKAFADECAKTGSYEGSPIEGFVVRCSRMEGTKKLNHFFKIKFDEPYLMFREWREVTKAIVGGREPTRFKFTLSQKYVTWAQGKFRQQPQLFKTFNIGKGIIQLRNMFLKEVEGLDSFAGSEIVKLCTELNSGVEVNEDQSAFGSEKTLLIPIATIASGKTSLARSLTCLYPDLIGHVQNDNIQSTNSKNSARLFEQQVMEKFQNFNIVFADRNNQLFQHREGLCMAFRSEYPGGKIVAINWDLSRLDPSFVCKLTASRVEARGENHQSLTPGRTKDYQTIIGSFVRRRDHLNKEFPSDSLIGEAITVNIEDSIINTVELVIGALSGMHCLPSIPSRESITEAWEKARNFEELFRKIIKGSSNPTKQSTSKSSSQTSLTTSSITNSSTKKKIQLPRYYGITIQDDLSKILEPIFLKAGKAELWSVVQKRMLLNGQAGPSLHHATLAFPGKENGPDQKKIYEGYIEKFLEWSAEGEDHPSSALGNLSVAKDGPDARPIGTLLTLHPARLYWNDRIVVLHIGKTQPTVKTTNKYLHVTLCTLMDEAKPRESNDLLELILGKKEGGSISSIDVGYPNFTLSGRVEGLF